METIHVKSTPVHTYGNLPIIGEKCPYFHLIKADLTPVTTTDFAGKRILLNIFPSLDTSTCAMSVRKFNKMAASYPDITIIAVSADLPFAASRFCATEHIEHVITASTFRSPEFGRWYGVEMTDGPLQGLLARAVFVIDEQHDIIYRELVDEISNEPNYQAALDSLSVHA